MIVTSIILLYTDSLISIDIEIPRGENTGKFTSLAIRLFLYELIDLSFS